MQLDLFSTFVKYDFPVTEDLCKQFITVVAGLLVFSLTFSEKIVNFATAQKYVRVLLGLSWAALLFAIISGGLGLTYICIAGGQAVYQDTGFKSTASTAYRWIVVAGCSFIFGLTALIVVALARSFAGRWTADYSTPPPQPPHD